MTKKILSIDEIIENELVTSLFQPLVSVRKKEVIGFEALSRGINPITGERISPLMLIEEAERFGLLLELDRLFRKTALKSFAPMHKRNKNLMLSINIDNSVIEQAYGSRHFLKAVKKYNIDPGNIIIEILESAIGDTDLLKNFVDEYKSQGFLIAVDDFGSGFSNWDRIILLKPDIVKLDRSIIKNIESDFFKQETARSLIRLSHNTGSLVIAEGVETVSEAVKSLELDADIFQGFYFGRPALIDRHSRENLPETIGDVYKGLIRSRSDAALKRKMTLSHYDRVMDSIISEIKVGENYMYQDVLENILARFCDMECLYILNTEGIQISRTIANRSLMKPGRSRIFSPDEPGTDQSHKEYYFNLKNAAGIYLSEPYISLATGSKCVTISKKFCDSLGVVNILCIDISVIHKKNEAPKNLTF